MRTSRFLTLLGAVLGSTGVALLLGLLLRSEAVSVPVMTLDAPSFITPTPAYLNTPLPVPGSTDDAPLQMVLPIMVVDAEPVPEVSGVRVGQPLVQHIPQRIIIPSLQVDAPIEPVSWHTIMLDDQQVGQWDVPEGYAVGWHNTSAALGVVGNTVLNGHHNTNGEVFGNLNGIAMGAEILLSDGETQYRYRVAQSIVLQEQWQTPEERLANARWIQPSHDERLTLVTCWPPESNSHRLIVVAVPEPDVE